MRIVDRLARREPTWRELDALLRRFEGGSLRRSKRTQAPSEIRRAEQSSNRWSPPESQPTGKLSAAEIIRLGELYRSACADLMLAEAYDLPRDTVAYLHALVARAHNALYQSKGFRFRDWATELFRTVPRQLRADPTLRLSTAIFYGSFALFGLLATADPEFAQTVLGPDQIALLEEMYAEPLDNLNRNDAGMTGFYILNNAGIGLQCFAAGLLFGLGTIWILFSNALILGVSFGHMATTPYAENFYTFVTAHGPFELTAIVFAGAAGLRLGWGLIDPKGQSRIDSLQREARRALPTAGAAVFLFVLAAFLEGFVSASPLPYGVKAGIALVSAGLLIAYLALGGRNADADQETDPQRNARGA